MAGTGIHDASRLGNILVGFWAVVTFVLTPGVLWALVFLRSHLQAASPTFHLLLLQQPRALMALKHQGSPCHSPIFPQEDMQQQRASPAGSNSS